MTYRGVAKGKTIEFEETLPFPEGQTLDVSVEPASPAGPVGSPAAVLEAMRQPPHIDSADVDELERLIAEGQLPAVDRGVFDEN